jgi:hypothetical protein
LDVPQTQLRAIVVPNDPVPVLNSRTQDFVTASTDYRTISGQDTVDPTTGIPVPGYSQRITQDDNNRVVQEVGEAPGGKNILPGTLLTYINYGNPTLPYGMVAIPETGSLPGVYYVVWNNYVLNPETWTNNVSQVVTWTSLTLP